MTCRRLPRTTGVFRTMEVSHVAGPGCPEPFYPALGFRHTGRMEEGELVLELSLSDAAT